MVEVLSTRFSKKWQFQTEASFIWRASILFVLNFADWLSTILALNYAREGNPLTTAIVNQPPLVSLVFKMIITILVCGLLNYAYNKGPKQYAKIGLSFLIIYYSIVIGNNLLILNTQPSLTSLAP